MQLKDMIQQSKINAQQKTPREEISSLDINKSVDIIRTEVIKEFKDQIYAAIRDQSKKQDLISYINIIMAKNSITNISAEDAYEDIFGLSFIRKYIDMPDFEELNGNSWDDIELVFTGGHRKISDKFSSPEQAINIIKKMALIGGATLDEAYPIQDSFIGTGLRLSATMTPIVDKEVGVTFSLRVVKGNITSLDKMIEENSYSKEQIDFILTAMTHGASIIFGGATSSGKTHDMNLFLYEVAKKGEDRIFTIEEDTREVDLIHKDSNNNYISRVIHNKTRTASLKNTLNADSDYLVKSSLRYHPDIIVPAEIRGKEALAAVEASLTGHTIVSSTHMSSVTKVYRRILISCLKADNAYDPELMMEDIVSAFPIVVFKKQLKKEDLSRRCLKIFEATGYDKRSGQIKGRVIYKFFKTYDENHRLIGEHRQMNPISNRLSQILYDNDCPIDEIQKLNPNFDPQSEDDFSESYIED